MRSRVSKLMLLESNGSFYKPVPLEDSAPGPKTIVGGDTSLGYYGWWNDTTDSSFINQSDIENATGLSNEGIDLDQFDGWLKFKRNGKFVYISKKPIRSRMSWDAIYLAGAVFGTNDIGAYGVGATIENYHAGGSALQNTTVTKNGHSYKIRLITGVEENPSNITGGEWNDLIYRIHESNGTWDTFSDSDIHVSEMHATICQETHSTSFYPERRVLRGQNGLESISYMISSTDNNQANRWRPVLEYI